MPATLALYNVVSAFVTHLNTIYANRYVMSNKEGSS